jgi:hypothetical protein
VIRKAPVDWRPPSEVMRSQAGTASIRGERSSGTTRLGLMLQPRVALSDAMLTARLGLETAGSLPRSVEGARAGPLQSHISSDEFKPGTEGSRGLSARRVNIGPPAGGGAWLAARRIRRMAQRAGMR